jgi:hypothetical protein
LHDRRAAVLRPAPVDAPVQPIGDFAQFGFLRAVICQPGRHPDARRLCRRDDAGRREADHCRRPDCLAESPSTEAATERIAAILREKAAAAGHPEKYHHTLTVFWMRMVAQLLDKDLPLAYYSANRLAGDAARTGWIEPDRRPL